MPRVEPPRVLARPFGHFNRLAAQTTMRHMKRAGILAFILLSQTWALAQASQPVSARTQAPQTVEIPVHNLRLKAYLWKPAGSGPFPAVLFNHGSGGATADQTAGMPITEAAARLAPVFVKHGYAFLFVFRRGQGLSADQAPFLQDVLQHEQTAHGQAARERLQLRLLTTEQLDDVMAALAFLKTAPGIDATRISIAGHSFGGQLTLLAAERDSGVRAAVTFGAASNSWQPSPDLRSLLLATVTNVNAPIMLIHAANDYDVSPGRELAERREHLHKPCILKIYPAVGQTSDDGHNAVFGAIPLWEDDVFRFLDANSRR
jgi:dienelactone hydrolase